MIIPLLLAFAQVSPSPDPPVEDIVVTANRRKCKAQWRGKVLSNRELDRQAANWAMGIAVRVRTPSRIGYKCLAQIAFRLADRGVTRVEFVEPDQ